MPDASGQPHGVTVVVACLDHEHYVETCLDSVYAQTLQIASVIITDDASADGTQTKVRHLLASRNWSATMVFHDRNRGICATFNEALALVKTPYVAFISADDWMDPRRVEKQLIALDSAPDACLVYGDMYLAGSDGVPTGETYSSCFVRGWPGGDHHELFPRLIECNWIPAPSVMSRTEALRRVGGFDETLPFEDYGMWLQLANAGCDFEFLPEPLVYYRRHENQMSFSTESRAKRAIGTLTLYGKYIGSSTRSDASLKRRFGETALAVYRYADNPREVAPVLWRAARDLPSPRTLLASCLASFGIPGPLLAGLMGRAKVVGNSVSHRRFWSLSTSATRFRNLT